MDDTPALPLLKRVPPAVRTALVWTAVALYPLVLVAAVRLAQTAHGAPHSFGPVPAPVGGASVQAAYPVLATLLPVGLLGRRPLLALASMTAGAFLAEVSLADWPFLIVAESLLLGAAVCFVAFRHPRRTSAVAAGLTCAGLLSAAPIWLRQFALGVPAAAVLVLLILTAWLIGNSVRQHREYADSLRARNAAQAVTAERLEIARELHDLVAHSIGIIAIQAGVGSRVMDTQPEEARNALRAIEATSRETLAGLRRTLGSLRRPVTGLEPGLEPAAQAAPRGPAPMLADVERLAEATGATGLAVEVRWRGERRVLASEIELSAFRIIQEAVTNVVRHAGTRRCEVLIDYQEALLSIEIGDRGRGGDALGAGGGSGFGLIGMRERVALLHGEFSAGPRPGGGFRVAARLPVPVTAAEVVVR
ncbi:sensor histidine kinase [Kitasatospora sp. GAS204B]|uniref:sensor histidine kinase n=1 Tax=unclassified Kitasatospora TaxID=2633591 RepID=UPI002473BE96|nr:histidine kinase [Kitasatospora sp. GAS204B]